MERRSSHLGPVTTPGKDPARIGNYVVQERIASGHVGTLYRVHVEDRPDKIFALKLIHPAKLASRSLRERLRRTAHTLLDKTLPHVVPLVDFFERDQMVYFIHAFIDGSDLGRLTDRGGAVPAASAVSYLCQLAEGLSAAYESGLLHGDIRPGHLMMDRGDLSIIGFQSSPTWRTAHGRPVIGDPAYLSPEIAQGNPPDIKSDIYALGCTTYELLTGRPPFGMLPPDALLACHAHEVFPKASTVMPQVPPALDELLGRMGAKNPSRRPQSYDEVLEAARALARSGAMTTGKVPTLQIIAGRQQGQTVELPEGDMLLGRTPGDGFVVDDGRISRRHAMLTRTGGRVSIKDLGSRNGIKVNGAKTISADLGPGDRISLGDTVMQVTQCDPVPKVVLDPSLPASPVRGAYGAEELARAPARQLTIETLSAARTDVPAIRALARFSLLLLEGAQGPEGLSRAAIDAAQEGTAADAGMIVPFEGGRPLLEARNASEAQLLSVVLPAVERARAGAMSVRTNVKVGRQDHWSTALAPILRDDEVVAYLVVVEKSRTFDEGDLEAVEVMANLLTKRHGMHSQEDTVVIPLLSGRSYEGGAE